MEDKEKKIMDVLDVLRKHGIKMSVAGCGCCGSPYVSFEYKNEMIADGYECFTFDMFDKEE